MTTKTTLREALLALGYHDQCINSSNGARAVFRGIDGQFIGAMTPEQGWKFVRRIEREAKR